MGRGRPRGPSDLSRPTLRSRASSTTYGLPSIPAEAETPIDHAKYFDERHSLPVELLTAILLPLPYLLGSLVRPLHPVASHHKHSSNIEAAEEILEEAASTVLPVTAHNPGLFQACVLASCTLILVGMYGRLRQQKHQLDRRRSNSSVARDPASPLGSLLSWSYWKKLFLRMAAVGLPFLATVEIGGVRTGLFLLAGAAEGLIAPDTRAEQIKLKSWRRMLQSHKFLFGVFILSLLADLFYLKTDVDPASTVRGYAALVKPILLLQSPMPPASSPLYGSKPASPLISSAREAMTTITAGTLLAGMTFGITWSFSTLPHFDTHSAVISTTSVFAAVSLLIFSRPICLRSAAKPGFVVGLVLCLFFNISSDGFSSKATVSLMALCGLAYMAAQLDTRMFRAAVSASHSRQSSASSLLRRPPYAPVNGSKVTQYLLRASEDWPLIHSILAEKDSRRITYFMLINLAFMFIQTFYSIVSGSLGLLSDSIHMLFDCVGLFAGLVAAIMSKWPPNARFPYGYGKVEVLSGLGNGIFLMIISVEIIWESLERVTEGAELKHMNELLAVSVAGLLVNLLGLQLAGHHHHHGHGHSHGHPHHHHHHEHANGSLDSAAIANGSILSEEHDHHQHSHGHSGHHHHGHDNENMAGIYLHILADTMGSVAVIASTILTKYTGWYGWDPIASFVIAVLIIAASYPLVVGSAKQLLLSMPEELEYPLRSTLQGISDVKGVSGYAVPRFWVDESQPAESHDHHHSHEHGHAHKHEHTHGHTHHHSHSPVRPRSSHSHANGHSHAHHHSQEFYDAKQTHSRGLSLGQDHSHAHPHNQTPALPNGSAHTHGHGHLDHDTCADTHDHDHDHTHMHPSASPQHLLGVIHIIARPNSDIEDVRQRVDTFLRERNMDVLVHVEKEGLGRCWCGGGLRKGSEGMNSAGPGSSVSGPPGLGVRNLRGHGHNRMASVVAMGGAVER